MNHQLKSIFEQQGYLVLPNFISSQECEQLITEQEVIINNQNCFNNSKIIFDTGNQQHAQEQYFFDSARSIKLFYEKDAFDQNGSLTTTLDKAINKMGHALHDFNPVFERFSYQEKFKSLIYQDLFILEKRSYKYK